MADKGEDDGGSSEKPLININSASPPIKALASRQDSPRRSRRRPRLFALASWSSISGLEPQLPASPSWSSFDFSVFSGSSNKQTERATLELQRISDFVVHLIIKTTDTQLQHGIFRSGQLSSLRNDVKIFHKSEAGPFLFERFKALLLPKGMSALRGQLKSPIDFALVRCWPPFYKHVLPALQAIFVQDKFPTGWDISSIRNAVLASFRDEVLLPFQEELQQSPLLRRPINGVLKNMLLVLQGVHDSYPPSEQRLQLEPLVARVVSPYLGFKGFYFNGNSEPEVVSEELQNAHLRRPSVVDPRRLQRPLSVSSGLRVTTLTDLFREAHLRQRESFI